MAIQRQKTPTDGPSDPSLPSFPSAADLSGIQKMPVEGPRFEEDRYEEMGALGEGGMGEVRLCHDTHIGRDVAMKMLLPNRLGNPQARSRFMREALIQAQLEHPSIVPVYEVGRSPAGVPTFTMKRVRGRTLEDVIDRKAEHDAETVRRFPRARLLGAFSQVCLAVDFAHSRGVVHRDLKPANIMLGDFGEVHVLDWGVARVRDEREVPFPLTKVPEVQLTTSVLGTPGYVAPEQIRAPGEVDGRADVYALGCILFEILSLNVLHRGANAEQALLATFRPEAAQRRLQELDIHLPAELEHIVRRATATQPDQRFATARQLHDAIQSYLDVDRDREREQRQADELAKNGLAHAARARRDDGGQAAEHHRKAIRRLGRALALAPGHPVAARGLADLLTDPPEHIPADAGTHHAETEGGRIRAAFQTLGRARLTWLFYVPLLVWMGLHEPGLVLCCLMLALGAGLLDLHVARLSDPPPWLRHLAAAATLLTIMPLGFAFGPFFVAPLIVAASMPALVVQADRVGRYVVLAAALVTVFGPIALEWSGLIAPTHLFEDGSMTLLSNAVALPELPTRVLLTVVVFGALATSVAMIGRIRDVLVEAEDRMHRRAWQLRQLVPGRTGRHLGKPEA